MMSEHRNILAESVSRLFRESAEVSMTADRSSFPITLWQRVEALGLPLLLVPENSGGVGGDWEDAFEVMHTVGRYAVPLPIGETIVASHLLAACGINVPDVILSIAPEVENASFAADDISFSGHLLRVPWGRHSKVVITTFKHQQMLKILCLPMLQSKVIEGENCAGEPRDTLVFDHAKPLIANFNMPEAVTLLEYAALLRAAQISGALEAALQLSIDHARQRKQFGRSISQFQAVQQQLALFGEDSAAANSAARSAFRAIERIGHLAEFAIGAAKLRANLAIGVATAIAHQVHAAIGFTREYALRHYTQRLWAWRSEYGNDRYWSERLGSIITARDSENFWSDFTATDDAATLVQTNHKKIS